jgi:hypothetical protein
MTIPTDYQDQEQYNSATNLKHPIITFQVVLNRQAQEANGPITNQRVGDVLHPDMYQSNEDLGRTQAAQHEVQFREYLPGFLRGNNLVRNDNGTFTVTGQEAVYLKKMYADIPNPLLIVTNSPPYTTP